eukprot:CAMPEP_0114596954 /NCGR_PEP_ID=MMETSP0125-20121206/19160_1 /TAXON_ID=485358 ORGANISM="Aristerostoma sp., Strain ATCC 50986" /NCGR_SAMPLE_ID=MMETSP0125 /ASSEMBLY_ACC=CAM_ASM_000245 /LENGTH=217 /DNA_ID=CAMNT_0001800873 /DNA_START=2102 /DNA_END=2755 /DNA_ORIENTATION=+
MKKVLINLMSAFYWTNLSVIKNNLKNTVKEQGDIDELILEIAEIDQSSHKIRLKDHFLKEFDPYFFYKTKALAKSIVENYSNRSEHKGEKDIVSGFYYTDLPDYLYEIQSKFFSNSTLFKTLRNQIMNINEQTISVLAPSLHLIFMALKYTKHKELVSDVQEAIKSAFAYQGFIEHLKGLLLNDTYKDYHPCIKKIFAMINFFPEDMQALIPMNKSE